MLASRDALPATRHAAEKHTGSEQPAPLCNAASAHKWAWCGRDLQHHTSRCTAALWLSVAANRWLTNPCSTADSDMARGRTWTMLSGSALYHICAQQRGVYVARAAQ